MPGTPFSRSRRVHISEKSNRKAFMKKKLKGTIPFPEREE
jgi:hypothetical protein